MRAAILLLTAKVFLAGNMAQGHEFWIDPTIYFIDPGGAVVANLRVGTDFEGSASSYFPQRFRQFVLAQGEDVAPVDGRIGDRPALNQLPISEGLNVALYVTTDSVLTYKEWAKFVAFAMHKDAPWALRQHRERGLPETDFVEAYSRYAKSLIAVGDGAGQDRNYGLLTEIVALANPYTDDLDKGLPVQVLYQGEPRRVEQLEVYEKAPDGQVTVTRLRTDSEGIATVPVKAGHTYMLDSVVFREPEGTLAQDRGAVWETLWANLTFAVPE